ncbi:hypothetical protein [Candidatus Liberibacter sp.]|uniref:hypothetical protein n=1 Tax=Candidatus Liberibacter sp. TaxID=34022 RepID=UPI0015F3E0EE|nr:hypothetical protein [Candidatus Liberibacter sp.]MBA5723718.1 hypothetical protein [Candidatus Liberibacter sp.]
MITKEFQGMVKGSFTYNKKRMVGLCSNLWNIAYAGKFPNLKRFSQLSSYCKSLLRMKNMGNVSVAKDIRIAIILEKGFFG